MRSRTNRNGHERDVSSFVVSGCIAWFARNPVAANLLMFLIAAGGLLAGSAVKVEVFPELELDRIGIQVPYLGAAAEEVESGVVTRIEGAVHGIDGVRRIVSTATEGNASVMVDIEPGADPRRLRSRRSPRRPRNPSFAS